MRRRLKGDYQEVNGPQVLDKELWRTSGHWDWFRENMLVCTPAGEEADDERLYALKPMNCPGHIQIFKYGLTSYRNLPVRLSEFGVVHRYEPSGALHGLLRVRAFTQDDAHIFCTGEQIAAECHKINELILSTYADFGFEEVIVKLSTRPVKRVGTDNYARSVHGKLSEAGLRVELDLRNEKINYKVREHSIAKVPIMLVCGKREAEEEKVSIRRLGQTEQQSLSISDAFNLIVAEAIPPDMLATR
jgi:threonyl-tRNA synthetase